MHAADVITAAAVLSALIWLYLLLGRGFFWRIRGLKLRHAAPCELGGLIAVIVPARNEAEVIERSITSLLQQSCAASLHIVLVDDGSTDGTATIARSAAARAGVPSLLTIIEGQPLPAGWSGKLWALQQGVEKARALEPRFLLLTDADIQHAADNVASLVAMAESRGCALASVMVKLQVETLADKLLIPAFVFFFFKLYPPAWIADPRRATAGAAGGCILLRPEALAQAGGVERIRGEIIDDCALARAVKSRGGALWLGVSDSTVSLRRYGAAAEIGKMVSRGAFSQLRHSWWLLLAAVAGMVLTYLLPPALLVSGRHPVMALAAASWAAMTVSYLPMVRFYGLNPLWALTLPVAAVFYIAATIHSALQFRRGRGGQWKGRVQDVR